ncbi:MAG: allantoinase AllB [Proteobacteria bacterium]|nr:allantoinase AllB [Pseudomonadota bacterium]MCP4919802.1 allantoinase AllB [Pseudomonadota bacterium]
MALVLRSSRVVLPDGVRPAVVIVRDGRIAAVVDEHPDAVDLGDLVLSPGLVDCHVHLNEPGRTEWEGFWTATQAAAAGGVTTLVDMPLNCQPVTTTRAALDTKLEAAKGQLHVDVGFWGGVVPGNDRELAALVEGGVLGAKAFLCHSGIDEFPNVVRGDLLRAMPELSAAGVPLLVHAELESEVSGLPTDASSYARWLAARPRSFEDAAIQLVIELVRETGCPAHIVHLSSGTALPFIADAKAEGLPLSVETCPHYLCLRSDDVPHGATHWKCAPPIRDEANRRLLWTGLDEGVIDQVVSDHSPCTPGLKQGTFDDAWGGIASLQLGLPAIWTEARERGHGLADLARLMSREPARLAGLSGRKGAIEVGLDADLVAWDPDARFTVDRAGLRFRHTLTPYLGAEMQGVVHRTWLRGECVFDGDTVLGPAGRTLLGVT